MKDRALCRKMKDILHTLRREAKNSRAKNGQPVSEWLSDNYYLLECEARQAVSDCEGHLKLKKGTDRLPCLFGLCKNLCPNGVLPPSGELAAFFSQRGLGGAEAQALRNMFRCALLDYAASGCLMQSSAGAKLLGNAVKSLRNLGETDFEAIIEASSETEKILMLDPDGIYGAMDERGRAIYRSELAKKAEKTGTDERLLARRALKKAQKGKTARERHVGSYIISDKSRKKRGTAEIITEAVLPAVISVALALIFKLWYLAPLMWLPLWEALRPLISMIFMSSVTPKYFFRLRRDEKRVQSTRTLITVSTLMPSAQESAKWGEKLMRLRQSNASPATKICCLADFKGAKTPSRPEDAAGIAAVKREIDALNRKYGGGFILAVRPRVYSKTQREFTGRERKRGAITELVRAIKGDESGFKLLYGDKRELNKTKYIFALDSDTKPVFDTVQDMIGVALHPLNQPEIDEARGAVKRGYGIFAPSACPELVRESSTSFELLLAGGGGISVYDSFAAERYQDLFDEGIFSGKGLIDVDAYYKLLDRAFPAQWVLSHDILEGGYLRTGFVSDLQVTDGFPSKQDSYYARLNRWVRGDWQNLRFIFGRNPLNALSRWKLTDNLRRSLTPVVSASALILSAFMPKLPAVIAACTALLSFAAPDLLGFLYSLTRGGFSVFSRLYYSHTLPSALQAFVRAFLSVVMLAQTAWTSLDAIVRACWRMAVSKKNLLQWTTAAQSEKGKGAAGTLLRCLPSLIFGAALIAFGLPLHRLVGILVLADIPFALSTSKSHRRKKRRLTYAQREQLLSYAAAMWSFFEDNCNQENNFLPPDNIQEAPVRAVAQRTSPTNIGMMLVSVLCARDFGFITSVQLYMRLNLSLASIEKLEKQKGNLFNWYSTATLQPLEPHFVSTVDSGNFLCCLVALRQGLYEYLPECEALRSIIDRITAIIDGTELSSLYNPRRELFYIAVDSNGVPSGNYYDLFMSEARMTAYYAVACRIVPKKHWGRLGRILVGEGRYTGLVSWTGTMFEYFMPDIFIPSPVGSLSYESLRFCLWCQRRKAGQRPWGASESGFYAFDSRLNYQYKAHGIQRIGLKRGLSKENVIAPYASFLTLTFAHNASLRNLKRLENMGMVGRYGFYEAVDFTKGRCPYGEFSIVSSFMAHHIGMSLLSVDNALKNNIIQRRFMSDEAMAGARSLLNENVPSGARVFKDIRYREVPKTHERTEGKSSAIENPSLLSPEVRIYSNGRWTTEISDCGTGVSIMDGVDLTCRSADTLRRPQGVFAVFGNDKQTVPLVKCLDIDGKTRFKAQFNEKAAVHRARSGDVSLKMQTRVLRGCNCEQRRFTVENLSGKNTLEGDLVIYFEPCLTDKASFSSHPMFSRLFLTDSADEENKILVFERNTRENEVELSLAAGFLEDCQPQMAASREKLLACGDGIFSLVKNKAVFDGGRGNPDACASFLLHIKLKPREKTEHTLLIAATQEKNRAKDIILTLRTRKEAQKYASDPFYHSVLDSAMSSRLLPAVFYPRTGGLQDSEAGRGISFGRDSLWSFGISGDYPIIYTFIDSESEIAAVLPYIRINKLLRNCSIMTDLVIAFDEAAGYEMPIMSKVRTALENEGCEIMLGVAGGVHAVNLSAHTPEQNAALRSTVVFSAEQVEKSKLLKKKRFVRRKIGASSPVADISISASNVNHYNFTDSKIEIMPSRNMPCVPWCLVLSNRNFGTIVSDKSLGFTWALNSRENKITPWFNDTRSDNRGEMLVMKKDGKLTDIIFGSAAVFTPTKAAWQGRADSILYSTHAVVATRGMSKLVTVNFHNTGSSATEFELAYYCEPVLGVNPSAPWLVFGSKAGRGAIFKNNFAEIEGYAALQCSDAADSLCFDRADFLAGEWSNENSLPCKDPCVAVCKKIRLEPDESRELSFCLSWGRTHEAALLMPEVSTFGGEYEAPIRIKTQDKSLDLLFNSFLYSQIKNSRFYGRTGFYQCGGAWGFRDQLQDSLAFIYTQPELTRTHLLRCAAVQFEQGDALHWWHVIPNKRAQIKGIRTRCSDDLLWLPYVLGEYVTKTGDEGILSVNVPYICGDELRDYESERYFHPTRSKKSGSMLEHCLRAVDRSLRFGGHGLALIGTGDWNDGFSRLGAKGNGESVWLTEFQIIVLRQVERLCRIVGMREKAEEYASISENLKAVLLKVAYDGKKFLRAFDDNGEVIGSSQAECCKIDILPQAFAAFSGIANSEVRKSALLEAVNTLVDRRSSTIRLLTPPFTHENLKRVGYIAAYPPGIRENGGQYTHAAVWLASACFKEGFSELGYELLSLINPVNICADEEKRAIYRAEPYVLAGDVSHAAEISGRAGWTQYTGSAAWYYLTVVEDVFGIRLKKGKLIFEKGYPRLCQGADIDITLNNSKFSVKIKKNGEPEVIANENAKNSAFEQSGE